MATVVCPGSPAVLVWLPVFYGELSLHSAFAPRDWHVHEMLYKSALL